MLSEPAFTELRTKKQLGYIVSLSQSGYGRSHYIYIICIYYLYIWYVFSIRSSYHNIRVIDNINYNNYNNDNNNSNDNNNLYDNIIFIVV